MAKRNGKVVWFNNDKGFGVIESNGKQFYAHYSEVFAMAKSTTKSKKVLNESTLKENQTVTFISSNDVHCEMHRALEIEVQK